MSPAPRRILVVNPNSNQAVTDGFAAELVPFADHGVEIETHTLVEGPFGVETQADIESVVEPLVRLTAKRRDDVDAIVIACYSDPGLDACREAAPDLPILGIQESGVYTAMSLGDRFGVIALSDRSRKRHLRYLRRLGVTDRLVGERVADLSVAESASGGDVVFGQLATAGRMLRDDDGADVIVLGCAGMATHRATLEADLGLPVVDPVAAAVGTALGLLVARST